MMDRQEQPHRLAIIAGGGNLPHVVAQAARTAGENPFIVVLSGESALDWSGFEHQWIGGGNFAALRQAFRAHGIGRVVMSGSVGRRPSIAQIRPTASTVKRLPSILRRLASGGDNSVLSMVIELIEAEGVSVIGVQDIVPALLAEPGKLGRYRPREEDEADIRIARQAAQALGLLDVGQGAVAVGGRVVALEGPEGTDQMLARVAELKASGRISAAKAGVLVKICKPQQDRRVDLPSIGPSTLINAGLAGLAGIAVEAGRSLVLDRQTLRELADRDKMFVLGLEPDVTDAEPRP